MQKQLVINIDEQVYNALYSKIEREEISLFIEDLVRSQIKKPNLEAAYQQMAEDKQREVEAFVWSEETLLDSADETW